MSVLSVGIEIDENRIRVADAHFKDGVVFLQALGLTESVPSFYSNVDSDIVQQKQAQALRTLYTDLKITNTSANLVLPDTLTYSQVVNMPILPEKELVSAIRYQADEFIPMNIDDTYLDLEVLRTDQKNDLLSILIVAAPKKIVDGIFHTVELAGLQPNKLETQVCAIGRLLSEIMKTKTYNEAYCVLNLGYSGSSLYLVDNTSHSIEFIRASKIGYELILREVMANLNLDITNAATILHKPNERSSEVVNSMSTSLRELSAELQRSIDAYVHKSNIPVTRIFTVNYSSQIYGFTGLVAEITKLFVEPLPLNTVYVPNTVLKVFSSEITEFASVVSTTII